MKMNELGEFFVDYGENVLHVVYVFEPVKYSTFLVLNKDIEQYFLFVDGNDKGIDVFKEIQVAINTIVGGQNNE